MNHPGEIAYLAGIARPTVALVNNAQREHQEFMRTVEATAYENGEVIGALPLSADGVAVFPADDPCTPIWRGLAGTRRVVDFALDADAVVTAAYTLHTNGAQVSMATPVGLVNVELAATGVHNVRNALAAAACAIGAGVSAEAIATGLQAFHPVAGRGVRLRTAEGGLLIDDTYNANPDSVLAAIDLLAGLAGEKLFVLGDMGEVGERGPEFHREVGNYARERGIDGLFALGEMTRDAVAAFGERATHCADVEALLRALRPRLGPAVTVLVKGSRFMRMERVVQAIAAAQPEGVH